MYWDADAHWNLDSLPHLYELSPGRCAEVDITLRWMDIRVKGEHA